MTTNISNDKRAPQDATMCRYIKEHFASFVGAMIYLSISCRPDISYAVGRKSKLQPITAALSHEAELIALAYVADEMM